MKEKRFKIELLVQRHPVLRKVAKYYSSKYNLDETDVYNRFIDFLCAETYSVIENSMRGVNSFVFDGKQFINRTVFGGIN